MRLIDADELDRVITDLNTNAWRDYKITRNEYKLISSVLFEFPTIKPQEPKTDVLDKIREEIEQLAKPNEIGGRGNGKSIRYGLCIALEIIDKYRKEQKE